MLDEDEAGLADNRQTKEFNNKGHRAFLVIDSIDQIRHLIDHHEMDATSLVELAVLALKAGEVVQLVAAFEFCQGEDVIQEVDGDILDVNDGVGRPRLDIELRFETLEQAQGFGVDLI